MIENTKYNYIFYNVFDDYFKPIFCSLSNYKFVKVFSRAFEGNSIVQKLFFLHWSAKINRKINLPLKKLWYKKMCCHKFQEDKPCCFIFLGGKYILQDEGLFSFIKKLNPKNKCVILYLDIASKNKKININKIKSFTDKIITYDKSDADRLQIDYLDMDYYTPLIDVTEPEEFENDVYFLGYAKDRLEEIHNSYKWFSSKGFKCKYIICGAKPEDRIQGEGLYYTKPITYLENLENVRNSKCILEIIQGKSVAPTLRLREAVTFKRKLITNNTNPDYLKSLSGENLCVYSNLDEIDIDFVNSEINYKKFPKEYQSPVKLINYLEETL